MSWGRAGFDTVFFFKVKDGVTTGGVGTFSLESAASASFKLHSTANEVLNAPKTAQSVNVAIPITAVGVTAGLPTEQAVVKGGTVPASNSVTCDNTNVTTALSWSPEATSTFAGNTTYTATLTLTAKEGNVFSSGVNVTGLAEGWNVDTSNSNTTKLTYTKQFEKTADKKLTSIAVTTEPTKKDGYIDGDMLDTAGMVVTGTYDDGSTASLTDYVIAYVDATYNKLKKGDTTVTIKATADATGNDLTKTVTLSNAVVGKTVAASDFVIGTTSTPYSGADQQTTLFGAITHTNITGGVTYTAKKGEEAANTIKDAGTYDVFAAVGDNDPHYAATDQPIKIGTVTVTPKQITPKIVLSPTSGNYTGADQKSSITVTVKESAAQGAAALTEGTDYTLNWTMGNVTATEIKDVGEYTVTVSPVENGNYSFTAVSEKFTMNKTAQTTALTITGASDKTYGGESFTVTVGGGDGTGAYSLTAAPAEAVSITAPASGGEFTVAILKACESVTLTASKAGDDNYDATGVNYSGSTATFKIAKKEITVAAGNIAVTKVFDNTTNAPEATGITGSLASDSILAADSGKVTIGYDLTQSSYAESSAGTAKNFTFKGLTLSGEKADNYVISSDQTTNGFTINTAKITPALLEKPTVNTTTALVYTGEQQTVVLSGFDENTMNISGNVETNAGEHTATVSLKNTTNSAWADNTANDVTLTWTIGRAPVVVPTPVDMPFTDSQLTVKWNNSDATTIAGLTITDNTGTNVAEYTATLTPDSNHQWEDNTTTAKQIKWKITPATVTVTWKIGDTTTTTGTYTGSEQTVTAVVMNGEMDVSSKFKFTDEAGVSKAVTNAGKYSFKVEAKEDTDKTNYTLPTTDDTQEITIEKATRGLSATPLSIKGVGGTGNITLAVTGNADGSAKDAALTVTQSPADIVTLPSSINKFVTAYDGVKAAKEGVTTLTFTIGETQNYKEATCTAKVTVDAGYTITVNTNGGTAKADMSTAAAGKTVTLTLTPASGYKLPSATGITGVTAAAVDGKDNEFTFTMPSADTTVTVTFDKEEYSITTETVANVNCAVKNGSDAVITKAGLGDTVKVDLSGDSVTNGLVSRVYFVKAETATDETPKEYDLTAGENNTYTFKMPAYAVKIVAVVATKHAVTVPNNLTGGSISAPTNDAAYLPGTSVTVTLNPASDYTSGGVTFVRTNDSSAAPEKATPTTTTNNYTFTMPDYPVTLNAAFITSAAQTAAQDEVKGGVAKVGESEVKDLPTAITNAVDDDTKSQIESAAAKVTVAMDNTTAGSMTKGVSEVTNGGTEVSSKKSDAVTKLAEAGIITVTKDGEEAVEIKNAEGDKDATVRVVNKVFLEVEVKNYQETGSDAKMTVDITPKQQLVATIVSENDRNTKLDETNSVPLGDATSATVNNPVDLTLGVPRAMGLKAGGVGEYIFLTHKSHIYRLALSLAQDGYNFLVSYRNTLGFSEFTLSVEDDSVAYYEFSGGETRYFTSFKGAVDDALANGKTTVTLRKNPTSESDRPTAVNAPVALNIVKTGDATITYEELKAYFDVGAGISKHFTDEHVNGGTFDFVRAYTVTISGEGTVKVDQNITLTATVKNGSTGDDVSSPTITWTSSDNSVATVDSNGKVTGKKAGNVTITAKYTNGADFTATKTITVTAANGGGTTTGGSGGGTVTAPVSMASGVRNGSVSFSNANAKAGEKVTVTPKPNNGYVTDSIVVKDDKGNEIPVTKNADGTFTFTMPASGKVTVTPTFVEESKPSASKFIDVDSGAYYADAVEWAVENGVTTGMSDATFAPEASCTRGQMVTFLWRAVGMPEPKSMNTDFADLGGTDAYYYKAVLWAVEQGITNGTGANRFSPDAIVNRGQVVTFLYRYEKASADARSAFADVNSSAYYAAAVNWAVVNGVTNGTGANKFSPDANCTRGQIVTFLYRDFVK